MLVLTRKLGESFMIDDSVTVTVLQVRGGKVRIGVQAPPQIKVFREEIHPCPRESDSTASATAQRQ